MNTLGNEPAFARGGWQQERAHTGMTIRTWLAGMALGPMMTMLKDRDTEKYSGEEIVARTAVGAVRFADALLAELEKPPQPAEKAPNRQSERS